MEINSSILVLLPGMYVLRHPKGGLPPLTVARAPGNLVSVGKIEILSTQKTHGAILSDGSDCIVMLVTVAPVELLITAFLSRRGEAMPTLRVDEISLDADPGQVIGTAGAAREEAAQKIEISGTGMSIIGHIERTGDVVVGEGKRLGEPSSDLRLEGFQVMWPDKPEGIDLNYSIVVEGGGSAQAATVGKFCGTRGEARRITEVTFALTGPKANHFVLDGIAYFTGGFQVPVISGIAASGPSGFEHLTALSLRAVTVTAPGKATNNPWDESPKTKLFKTKSTHTATAGKPVSRKTVDRPEKTKQAKREA